MNKNLVLPQSISTEKTLIGSILINPDLTETILSKLTADDFYDKTNQSIVKAIEVLFSEGSEIDIISISEHLIGDSEANVRLSECVGDVSTTTNPKNAISVLLNRSYRRKVIKSVSLINSQAINEDCSVSDVSGSIEQLNECMEQFCDGGGIKRRRRGKIVRVKDIAEDVEKFFSNGKERQGLEFKDWPGLSRLFRLNKGTVNVINGIPSHGKTTIVDAIIINSVMDHNWKWAIFSPENKPYYLHIQPMSEKLTGMPFFGDKGMDSNMLKASLEKLNNHIYFMEPDQENTTHKSLFRLMKDAIEKHNVDAILIDPWNKIDIQLRQNENDMKAIGRLLREYQSFIRTNMVWFGICAHPTKMRKEKGQSVYPVPTLYDLEGSSHWYNGVDNGLTVYRDFNTNHVQIHVQKIKFRTQGRVGMQRMRYNDFNSRMYEISAEQVKKNNTQESNQTEMWQSQF